MMDECAGGYFEEDAVMEQSFSIAGGDFTLAEKEYLRRKGLIYENSKDETLDISTDVGSCNSSMSRSHTESLLIFEENERVFEELMSKSGGNSAKKSSKDSTKTPERQRENKMSLVESPISPGCGYSPGKSGNDSDKENEFKGPISVQRRILFKDELEEIPSRDPLEEIKSMSMDESLMMTDDLVDSDQVSQMSEDVDEDVCLVPCTQDVAYDNVSLHSNLEEGNVDEEEEIVPCTQVPETPLLEESKLDDLVPCTQDLNSTTDTDSQNVVPCTQALNSSSINLNETYSSEQLEESLRQVEAEEELASSMSTQAPNASSMIYSEDGSLSRLDSTGCASQPCSQGSTVNASGVSKNSELDDTITRMEYLLKLADEQEQKDKLEAAEKQKNEAVMETSSSGESASGSQPSSQPSDNDTNGDGILFKTPLKHHRVKLLKNKKMASPSPPRSFANALLQQRGAGLSGLSKKPAEAVPQNKSVTIASKITNSASSSPINTSTPKRAPLAAITPSGKKNYTPGRGGILKTPVSAKVDTGLRGSQFPIGLSPVAKYIHDKPAPSKFARVQGVPNPKAGTATTTSSRIPLPPPRTSFVPNSTGKPKTPLRHSVLRTSTYFNLTSTPPQLVSNEKSVLEKKRFQPMSYTGPQKVKTINGSLSSPLKDDYVAHRHTGLRDESGNASFIQNSVIQRHNIPTKSRLTTPKSDYYSGSPLSALEARKPVRSNTFVISKE